VSFVVGGCGLAEDGGVRNTRLNMLQNAARMLNDMLSLMRNVRAEADRFCRLALPAVIVVKSRRGYELPASRSVNALRFSIIVVVGSKQWQLGSTANSFWPGTRCWKVLPPSHIAGLLVIPRSN